MSNLYFFTFLPNTTEPGELSRYNDSLRAGRSADRIPVGARFSAPVQTGSEAHPASYAMGTGSFPGVKRPGRGVDHPPPSSAEVKERVQLYLNSPSGPSWPVPGRTLPLPLPNNAYQFIIKFFCGSIHFVHEAKFWTGSIFTSSF